MSVDEFTLINRFFNRPSPARSDVTLGIGDDAAVVKVPFGYELVVSTDTLLDGVHFPKQLAADDIGYRALAVNLSDLAAMGAKPVWATLALTLPDADETWLNAFSKGFFQLADDFGVQLIGGDLTRGPLVITIQVLGLVEQGRALTRRRARPGDLIYVTGTLGDAAAGLSCYQEDKRGTSEVREALQCAFARPLPRIAEGRQLINMATSAIDLSDGLLADLGHILVASGVGATIELAHLPISTALSTRVDEETAYCLALSGGDDYELCFTVPPGAGDSVIPLWTDPAYRLTCIGGIESRPGLRCLREDGQHHHPETVGYRHF